MKLINATRKHPHLVLGCSPRAILSLVQASRARAYLYGRDYVVPEDLFCLAEDVILHRVRLNYEAIAEGVTGRGLLEDLVGSIF